MTQNAPMGVIQPKKWFAGQYDTLLETRSERKQWFIIPKALPPGTMNSMGGRKDEYGNESISFTFHNSVEQAERKQKI